MGGLGFDAHEHVVGQVEIIGVLGFSKPAFRLPAEEELTTTDSGLKYIILNEGGPFRPGAGAQVAAHYVGWLTDGTQFDASYDREQPLQSGLGNLIAGWQEGMRLVGRGGKVLLVIPSDLGYGDRDKSNIPAGSTLVFVVELIDFRG
jgi:peptidylprolyl isomerase